MPARAAGATGGLRRLRVGSAEVVTLPSVAPAIEAALMTTDPATRRPFATLHAWAAAQEHRATFVGRGLAYGVTLPGTKVRAVVRHNAHGGLLAPLTGDRFLGRSRAPHELRMSQALEAAGVRTPRALGYVRYPAGAGLWRVDVITTLVPNARDLSQVLTQDDPAARDEALVATASLIGALSGAGARHADLNIKNVLLGFGAEEPVAYVLDVDRVRLGLRPEKALALNLARFCRSARKWRDRFGAKVTEADLELVARLASERLRQG